MFVPHHRMCVLLAVTSLGLLEIQVLLTSVPQRSHPRGTPFPRLRAMASLPMMGVQLCYKNIAYVICILL